MCDSLCKASLLIVILVIILSPFAYWATIGSVDSTDYFLQDVDSAVHGDDGRKYVYVGDHLHVVAYNWRHIINGSCFIGVDRMRENVTSGRRVLMQHVDQQFVGDGIIRRTSWPIAPENIIITADWLDEGADEQEVDIFTIGWYDCNPLDRIRLALGVPRLHHNAQGRPERERTRIVVRRHKV